MSIWLSERRRPHVEFPAGLTSADHFHLNFSSPFKARKEKKLKLIQTRHRRHPAHEMPRLCSFDNFVCRAPEGRNRGETRAASDVIPLMMTVSFQKFLCIHRRIHPLFLMNGNPRKKPQQTFTVVDVKRCGCRVMWSDVTPSRSYAGSFSSGTLRPARRDGAGFPVQKNIPISRESVTAKDLSCVFRGMSPNV